MYDNSLCCYTSVFPCTSQNLGCTQEKEAEEEEEVVVAVSVEDLVEIIYMNLLRNYTRHDS